MHALLFIEGVNGRNMQKPHLISASDLDLVAISDSPHWHHSVLVFLSLRLKAIFVLKWISLAQTSKKKRKKTNIQTHILSQQMIPNNMWWRCSSYTATCSTCAIKYVGFGSVGSLWMGLLGEIRYAPASWCVSCITQRHTPTDLRIHTTNHPDGRPQILRRISQCLGAP